WSKKMPVTIAKGDIWAFPADVRINTVNCKMVMGKGIAKEFKERYPEMFDDYVEECLYGRLKPGGVHVWHKGNELILNVATKDHWRDPSTYEWIELGIKNIGECLDYLFKGEDGISSRI